MDPADPTLRYTSMLPEAKQQTTAHCCSCLDLIRTDLVTVVNNTKVDHYFGWDYSAEILANFRLVIYKIYL